MKKLLAIVVAAAFASVAFAQSKDVTDKKGSTVTDKKGGAVTTKDVKEKPQHPAPKLPQGSVKKKEPKTPGNVSTKRGEAVTDKKGMEVKSGQK